VDSEMSCSGCKYMGFLFCCARATTYNTSAAMEQIDVAECAISLLLSSSCFIGSLSYLLADCSPKSFWWRLGVDCLQCTENRRIHYGHCSSMQCCQADLKTRRRPVGGAPCYWTERCTRGLVRLTHVQTPVHINRFDVDHARPTPKSEISQSPHNTQALQVAAR
jgi:hypothetical protein